RDVNGQYCVNRFCDVNLAETKTIDQQPYTQLQGGSGVTVLRQLKNNDPLVVKSEFGKGTAFVFCGEWVNDIQEEFVSHLVEKEISKQGWLTFEPKSDWLEYSVSQRDGIWFISLFNHGRGFYPSGNGKDHGVWNGKLVLCQA
ncbi:MAG TPA: hypothetical protein VIJ25_16955, partial [Methylococcales bacterium]